MARLRIHNSGSEGNLYTIVANGETLILELGLMWKDILKALDYKLDSLVGGLVSHTHLDHSKGAKEAIRHGIRVFTNEDVAQHHKGVEVLKLGQKRRIGSFVVQPMEVPHSVPNYAYLIEHQEFGRLLFATDCSDFPYRIKNINHWLIEANHDENVILDRLCENEINRSQSDTHLSIDKTISVLKANFGASTQTITLIHLSDANSDEREFQERVKKELGFNNVYVANKGMEIELISDEF